MKPNYVGLVLAATLSCSQQMLAAPAPSYSKMIQPVLRRFCVDCHRTGKARGGVNLDSYNSLIRGGKGGAFLVPGKPDKSLLLLVIEGKAEPLMPPRKKPRLNGDQIRMLREWITLGAKSDVVGDPDPGTLVPQAPAAGTKATRELQRELAKKEAEGEKELNKLRQKLARLAGENPKERQKKIGEINREIAKKEFEIRKELDKLERKLGMLQGKNPD